MLVVAPESMLGISAMVRITSVGRWSVFGEVIETIQPINNNTASSKEMSTQNEYSPGTNTCGTCVSSEVPETCACEPGSCGQTTPEEKAVSTNWPEDRNSRTLIGWLLRKRKNHVQKKENESAFRSKNKQELAQGRMGSRWDNVDRVLLGGMLVSFLTIIALLVHLGFRIASD